ncbi:MAG: carbohydrate ABC transporter permease, partial [Vagococcus sp.]
MKKNKTMKIILYVILLIYAMATIYPFLWAIAASFNPLNEIVGGNLKLLSSNFTTENYQYIFGRSSLFTQWFLNSVIVATIGTIINIFLNTMAGYALARLQFPGRERIYYGFLALMMV